MPSRRATDFDRMVLSTIRGSNWRKPEAAAAPAVRNPPAMPAPAADKDVCTHCGQIYQPWNAAHLAHHRWPQHMPMVRASSKSRWRR
jgi:hypothetical protein